MILNTHYFIDFDNTVSNYDVWDSLVKACNPKRWREKVKEFLSGSISSREFNKALVQTLTLTEQEAHRIVLDIGIDPTFRSFVEWAENQNFPLMILSDGYDFYIDLLLKQEQLGSIPFYSNHMVWTEEGIQVEFPLYREDCEKDMAHCKCQHIEDTQDYQRIYIGDGMSDICAACKCDFVYAKRNLLAYCQQHDIAHKPFDTFQDVMEHEQQRLNSFHPAARIVELE